LPHKRGFSNIFRTEYSIVNVGRLNIFKPNSVVDQEGLLKAGLIKSSTKPVKILGAGELGTPLIVKADKFSATAKGKIETAEGRVEVRSAAETG
jgi:large subunit ribosomal protein L15